MTAAPFPHPWLTSATGVLVSLLVSAIASAEPTPLDRARDFFRAGAQAYAVGEYDAAVQAFEQAYTLVPRPAVLFSIAQAERRQYFVDNQTEHLVRALAMYKQYLELEPHGSRKADAVAAIEEITPWLPPKPAAAPTPPVPAAAEKEPVSTRLMVSSPVSHALLSLDDGEWISSPLIREVAPGEHEVRVKAPGYYDAQRHVLSIRGVLVTLDIPLVERPARLVVQARDGATLSIDGRIQGECPFSQPLELAPGPHIITLAKRGFVGVSREEVLVRGQTTTLRVPMPQSWQRTTSMFMFGAAASALTTAAVFSYLALDQQESAESFLNARGHTTLVTEDRLQYQASLRDRDRLRLAAEAATGVGLGLGVTGVLLLVLDPARVVSASGTAGNPKKISATAGLPQPRLGPGVLGLDYATSF